MLLTTEALVSEIPEKEKPAPAPSAGTRDRTGRLPGIDVGQSAQRLVSLDTPEKEAGMTHKALMSISLVMMIAAMVAAQTYAPIVT